jgi:hypothetical protein
MGSGGILRIFVARARDGAAPPDCNNPVDKSVISESLTLEIRKLLKESVEVVVRPWSKLADV